MPAQSLTASERELLQRLGLSRHAVELYGHMLQHRSLTAKEAAALTKELVPAEYRLFKQLEELGLVRRGTGRPVVFTAVPKDVGLRAAYLQFRAGLERLVKGVNSSQDRHYMEIMIGRQALYDKYAELAADAREEVCIYAIGIAYSKELERCQKDTLKRGVRIRHVLQQIKPSNFHVAHKWQKLGVDIRYAESERGFHLMLFDSRIVLLSFSDPEDTDDRFSLLTDNPAAARVFAADFENIWAGAQQVNV